MHDGPVDILRFLVHISYQEYPTWPRGFDMLRKNMQPRNSFVVLTVRMAGPSQSSNLSGASHEDGPERHPDALSGKAGREESSATFARVQRCSLADQPQLYPKSYFVVL